MTVFWRYWLLQIPGWILLIALLIGAREWLGISKGLAVLVFVAWLIKDAAIYPWLGRHYEARHAEAKDALVGARARTAEELNPRGYVKVRGELWLAELAAAEPPIGEGEIVVVESVEGLTLRVRRGPGSR